MTPTRAEQVCLDRIRRTIEQLHSIPEEMFADGPWDTRTARFSLERNLLGWSRGTEKLAARIGSLDLRSDGGKRVLLILPANSPAAWGHALLSVVAAGRPVSIRASRRRAALIRRWTEYFFRALPGWDFDFVREPTPREKRYFAVVVFGNDETVESVKAEWGGEVPVMAYGHRFSAAFLEESEVEGDRLYENLKKIVEDVIVWDQCGCLSPQVLYVAVSERKVAEVLCESLVEIFSAYEREYPRGDVAPGEHLRIHTFRAAVGGEGGRVWASPESTAWTVALRAERWLPRDAVGHRTLSVEIVGSLEDAMKRLTPYREWVEAVSIGGNLKSADHERTKSVSTAGFGPDVFVPRGGMQSVSLLRRHSGLRPLPLALAEF
ncbi:MAG: hypothetical protein D6679_07015 [Candidatus Hydrogenedentota bacterium]|nr:MAG: hypothetical protein D6679_07015 [Candidatus Hydrogenedentota bacterium]